MSRNSLLGVLAVLCASVACGDPPAPTVPATTSPDLQQNWDRSREVANITVPTLVIGARHDTMDPAHMEMMSKSLAKGRYLYCPNGSHMALYDDQETYVNGVIAFLKDVDAGRVQ